MKRNRNKSTTYQKYQSKFRNRLCTTIHRPPDEIADTKHQPTEDEEHCLSVSEEEHHFYIPLPAHNIVDVDGWQLWHQQKLQPKEEVEDVEQEQ